MLTATAVKRNCGRLKVWKIKSIEESNNSKNSLKIKLLHKRDSLIMVSGDI